MSIIDFGILAVLSISVLIGMYRGFTVSIFNTVSFFVSWFFALVFHPLLTKAFAKHFPDIIEKIVYYSEGSSRLSFANKTLPVSSLSLDQITDFVKKSGLPYPFNKGIRLNLIRQNLGGLDIVGHYIDYTVANIITNLISFMMIFLFVQFLSLIVISLAKNFITLPVLKKHDGLAAGALGLFRGILFLFIIFAFVPLLYIVVPGDLLERFLGSSKLIKLFLNTNFFTAFLRGVV